MSWRDLEELVNSPDTRRIARTSEIIKIPKNLKKTTTEFHVRNDHLVPPRKTFRSARKIASHKNNPNNEKHDKHIMNTNHNNNITKTNIIPTTAETPKIAEL